MGKDNEQQVEIVQYYMSLHFGICAGPVDYISTIYCNERIAWQGSQSSQGIIEIDNKELFGGEKKEGGVYGKVFYLPGSTGQIMPSELTALVGLTPETMPAYRGMTSIWFYAGDPQIQNRDTRGFYWSANNPFLPTVWVKTSKAAVALGQQYARIWRGIGTGVATGTVTVNLNAVSNASSTDSGGLSAGVTITATENQVLSFSLPTGQLYTAWSAWGDPSPINPVPGGSGSLNKFRVIRDDDTDDVTNFGSGTHDGYEAARAAFEGGSIGDGTRFTFYLNDTPVNDNTGGLSIKVDYFGGYEFDANPSHMIYEALTNSDWGMGSPTSAIDISSFLTASATLYAEGFGLSMMWVQQSTIESFISEILDHIEATLFVNPSTGLLQLKLIRNDYSIPELPVFTPDNSVVTKFSRKLWGETINEIIVTWTNPENEEEETVTAQDNSNIAIQGGVVSDGRNYYGVRRSDLAAFLAHRDLRAASTPLASCDIEVNREGWNLLPGDVCVLNSPEDGIESIVMRVGPVEYGKPGDPTVKASLVEDVWSLALADYTDPPASIWEPTSEAPSTADFSLVFTMPYYFMVSEIPSSILSGVEYPEVFAGVLAGEDGPDTFEFELYGEVTDNLGNVSIANIGTKTIAGHATLPVAFEAEAETEFIFFSDRSRGNGPSVGGFMLIEGADETEHEFCLFTAIEDDSPQSYTVYRGVLDTVPRDWPLGTPVWFIDSVLIFHDPTIRSEGEAVDYYILPRTSLGLLPFVEAPLLVETLTGRPHYPTRPANVTVNGNNGFSGLVDLTSVDPIPTAWSRRNRLTEDTIVLPWTASDVAPEEGQTTTVRLTDLDGNTLHEYTGIVGTSQNVDPADFGIEEEGYIEFIDVRDGMESLQSYRVRVIVTRRFEFEDGDDYLFEDGTQKEFED